ncbi:hypothetical protein NUH16_006328 [Penicillium rubens]|uniref:uncharacterized protein n=1 Tax=Penicillium rubens TaxID=1108849 RepID=UPI002A59AACF|nr:uncharacterized protein N7525_009069 [Penicillium rubens]KAJ5047831.1 hypothetical protein NUH16_006328 [Penicillium rubens]KAJ5830816.1 hypothetical protein N7525_009069 [Penicillium rubens]
MEVAIIGAGVIGLLSALTLTDSGYRVTIIARDLPGDESQDWASPWAGAAIFPHPDTKGHLLQVESFKYFWALAHRDPTSGIQVIKATEYYDDRDDDSTIWYKSLVPQYRRIPTNDLPDGVKMGFTFKTMTVNPAIFLPWTKKELEGRGVRFIRKEIKGIEEAKHITGCGMVVHAPGLGASELANDNDVVAVRGQTMFVETDFDELIMLQGSQYTYIIPRMYTGGAIIGGVSQEGNLDRGVDESLRSNILSRVRNLSKRRLDSVDLEKCSTRDIVAFRPARKGGYRLETEETVVHAYGFGSLGYTYGYGAALKVRELIESVSKGLDILKSRL